MAKPKHTFMLIKGKAKVAADAQESRGKANEVKSEMLVNAADYLLKQAKIDPSKLTSGLKILEDAKKATKDRIDQTQLGKLKEVLENVKKLAEQIEKLGNEENKLVAELSRPTKTILMARSDIKPDIDIKSFINLMDVLTIFIVLLIKIRAKGAR